MLQYSRYSFYLLFCRTMISSCVNISSDGTVAKGTWIFVEVFSVCCLRESSVITFPTGGDEDLVEATLLKVLWCSLSPAWTAVRNFVVDIVMLFCCNFWKYRKYKDSRSTVSFWTRLLPNLSKAEWVTALKRVNPFATGLTPHVATEIFEIVTYNYSFYLS